jgi:hypothetical protein
MANNRNAQGVVARQDHREDQSMKRILYSGGTIVTGDQVADAILEYASELARHEFSDTIDVPTITDAGLAGHTQLLLGPASQFVVEEYETGSDDPIDEGLVETIREKTAHLQAPKPIPSEGTSGYPDLDEPTEVPDPPLAHADS